jgi:hypothetical protein
MIVKIMVLVSGYFVGADCLVMQSAHAAFVIYIHKFFVFLKRSTNKQLKKQTMEIYIEN